jgi:iron(III) transport system substrate-binding protein
MKRTLSAAFGVALATLGAPLASAQEINLYTAREPALIKPVLDAFTAETGVKVNVVFAQNGLEERVAAEGATSPADMLLLVDVSRLELAKSMGITQPVTTPTLTQNVPADLRDPSGHWHAATLRARVFYVSKDRVRDTALTYESLAEPRWRGKVCSRDGQNVYNTSLFSAAIARMGEAGATQWLTGVKANLAKRPSGGDRDVARDIAAGLCDIGIANTYYVGLMLNREPERKPWAEAIRVVMPTFANGGTHVNISGFAVAKNAPNRANAVRLGEWLTGERAQSLFARQNFEHPIRVGIALDPTVEAFGPLKADTLPLLEVARNRKAASELVDKVKFNEGPSS